MLFTSEVNEKIPHTRCFFISIKPSLFRRNYLDIILDANNKIKNSINYLDQFTYTPGDINQDTIIDILDMVIIINNILGSYDLNQIQFYSADMNEDGIINIQDVIIIINIILNYS